MFNYGGYPPWNGPSQPIVFMPPPPNQTPPGNPLDQIRQWKQSIEELEKAFKKEEKPKDDKKKDGDIKVVNMMLLMILLSPITGPIMSWFFHKGLALMNGG